MEIYYTTAEEFYEGVYILVTKGLTFKGDFLRLKITLTGGY